jgi:hypothetical protein
MTGWTEIANLLGSEEGNKRARNVPGELFVREELILQLLKLVAASENKPLEIRRRVTDFELDAWAPEGLEDLPGPTAVEVRLLFSGGEAMRRARDVLSRLALIVRREQASSILFIVAVKLPAAQRERLRQFGDEYLSPTVLRLWDVDDLSLRLEKFGDALAELLPRLHSLAVKGVVTRGAQSPPDEWKEERQRRLQEVRRSFEANGLVLVLGAGVSASAGIPDWNTLLSRLLVRMIENWTCPPN